MEPSSGANVVVQFRANAGKIAPVAKRSQPLNNTGKIVLVSRLARALTNHDKLVPALLSRESFDLENLGKIAGLCLQPSVYDNLTLRDHYCADVLEESVLLFTKAFATIENANEEFGDVFKQAALIAETGFYFIREMRSDAYNLLNRSNPFTMLHTAAIVVADMSQDIDKIGQRNSFWISVPQLRDRMEDYCREIHATSPVSVTEQEASIIQRQNVRRRLSTLHSYAKEAVETNTYRSDFGVEKRTLNILMSYMEPFSDEDCGNVLPLDHEAPLLSLKKRGAEIQELRKKRDERHAAHPELFFSDRSPIIR